MNQNEQMINTMAQHSEPKFDKTKTALLFIDLVNDGSDENGFFKKTLNYDISLIQGIEPNVINLIAAAKQNNMPVIGVQAVYDFEYISPAMREQFEAIGIKGGLAPKGAWGSEIIPKIRETGLDLILVKSHYSAFAPEKTFGYRPGNNRIKNYMELPASDDSIISKRHPGYRGYTMQDYFKDAQESQGNFDRFMKYNDCWRKTENPTKYVDVFLDKENVTSLDFYLKEKEINTLIITGASTHVCVDSTIAAASEKGYKIFEPIDAVAAEGIPGEGFQRHFMYLSNHGMFKTELTTSEKLIEKINTQN